MTLEQLEKDVAELKVQVAALQARLPPTATPLGALQLTPQEVREMEPYQRYIRQTGQLPPAEWKPGDPIPEPEWWGASPDADGPTR